MYTTKDYQNDLYEICTKYFVKMKLLKDLMENRITSEKFNKTLKDEYFKSPIVINEIVVKLNSIHLKIHQNGGQLTVDPITLVKQLTKANQLQSAFNIIIPIIQTEPNNEEAAVTFGWLMYKYLKQSENTIQTYVNNLKVFNDTIQLKFKNKWDGENEKVTMLKNSIIWSIRQVVQKHESNANILLPELLRFCDHGDAFIEKRLYQGNEASAARTLIKEIRSFLNLDNYLLLMDSIGFKWFDKADYVSSSFENKKEETIVVRPFAEVILNMHAKKLLELTSESKDEQRICMFIDVLQEEIKKNPKFEWLPYYQVKLLMKVDRKQEALQLLIEFARLKNREFWVWNLLSELIEEDDKFNCLCAALLCKTKPEMLVSVQEKIIPYLVNKEMQENAKFEVDQLFAVRMRTWGKVPSQITNLQKASWYNDTIAVNNRDNLKPYADKAELILYETLPYQDVFVTYVNIEKSVINFAYIENHKTEHGYFYIDSLEYKWKVDETLKVKMSPEKMREQLYKVYDVVPGDAAYREHFINSSSGYVEKEDGNAFAFASDVYISPKIVQQYKIEAGNYIEFVRKKTFNKKRNNWNWAVEDVTCIKKDT